MKEFIHKHAAHCESGAASSLITHHGFEISESMCFGISSSLAFAYLPFITINYLPLISYRMPPKHVLKGISKALGIKFNIKTFKNNKDTAQKELDSALSSKKIVGIQASVFFLPYFPESMRFHFNAHNLLVFEKNDDIYSVSDPVFDFVNYVSEQDLLKARFAKGALAPNGIMYTISDIPKDIDLKKAIKKAIKKTTFTMLRTPAPIIGIWGMKTLAKKIAKLKTSTPQELRYTRLFIAQIIRMQEEIGTGGGGFRFMYAAFLQEAAQMLDSELLDEAALMMSDAGDLLREFALIGAKMIKNRDALDVQKLSNLFMECANSEKIVFEKLRKLK